MKIILIGASGTIGKTVTAALENKHEIIRVGNKSGDFQVDITSSASIESLFKKTGAFDALVSAAGGGYWGPFRQMTETDFYEGIRSKMMGQINLVLLGQQYINPKGSFTLTTGILGDEPVREATNLTVVNAAVNAFVLAAATELENGVRINAVSPGVVVDSLQKFGPLFPGHIPVDMNRVGAAYVKSVESALTGQVFRVY